MPNFYSNLEPRSFWRRAVGERTVFGVQDIYRLKFPVSRGDRITVAGSCFAQHVAVNMRKHGFNILDVEPAPDFLEPHEAQIMGYGIHSARYGNIYTARQLCQLLTDASGCTVRDEDFIRKDGRHVDALRPDTEPEGYDSLEEARLARLDHLEKVKLLFASTDLLVFALGLTEAWKHRLSGTVYPVLPDTITDQNSDSYKFHNFTCEEVAADLRAIRQMLQAMSPGARILLMVSPVPLTATASASHVMVATSYSKSVLRAVCGEMEAEFGDVDYFPLYEFVTSTLSRGVFYEPNMRNVSTHGIDSAMLHFHAAHGREQAPAAPVSSSKSEDAPAPADEGDLVCGQILLEAYSR